MFLLYYDNGGSCEEIDSDILIVSQSKETLNNIKVILENRYAILKQRLQDERSIADEYFNAEEADLEESANKYREWVNSFTDDIFYDEKYVCTFIYDMVSCYNYSWRIVEMKEF